MASNAAAAANQAARIKRPRVVPPSLEDLMHYARIIMEKDPFKHKAPREEERSFRALFGCGPQLALILWNKLSSEYALLPVDATITHLLWTLMYCKQYGKWKTMRKLTNTDPKTLRKWISVVYCAFELMEPFVVCSTMAQSPSSCRCCS